MPHDTVLISGSRVKTYDGRSLGVIRDVQGGRLLLSPRARRPYWLPAGLVRSVEGDCVTLHISSRVVGRYRERFTAPRQAQPHRASILHVPAMCSFLAATVLAALTIF